MLLFVYRIRVGWLLPTVHPCFTCSVRHDVPDVLASGFSWLCSDHGQVDTDGSGTGLDSKGEC